MPWQVQLRKKKRVKNPYSNQFVSHRAGGSEQYLQTRRSQECPSNAGSGLSNIILRIEDDGKGFEIERRLREAVLEKRMGIISMRERANLLGGKVRITSKEGKGTKVVVKFTYQKK